MPDETDDGTEAPPDPGPKQTRREMYTCVFCAEQSPMEEAQQWTEGGSFYLRCTACGETV